MKMESCQWPGDDVLMKKYHDEEWGVPVFDDKKLFEFLVLDAFQAGLSWRTVLHKREAFRIAFDNFDYKKITKYSEDKMLSLMSDTGIIRNKLKIKSTTTNAQAFIKVQKEFGTFSKYIWQFTNGKTIDHECKKGDAPIVTTAESDAMSKDLVSRGFKFVGSTICYAFMQAAGMCNDHWVSCPQHKLVKRP